MSTKTLERLPALGLRVLALVAISLAVITTQALATTNQKHFFWAPGQAPNPSAVSNDLIYHGGHAGPGAIGVETTPGTYLIFWGPDWANGFTTTDVNGKQYTSKQLQNYVTSFLSNLGGTSWASIQTEYCNNVPAGTTSCANVSAGRYVTNPRKQLKGVWTDATPVPSDIVALGLAENVADDPLAVEAIRASTHFKYDPQATYIILTPPTSIATGQPVYCVYHTQTNSVDGLGNPYRLQYAFIPFLNMNWPGLGTGGCGMNSVNAISDSFGHGVFDGYSIVTGHEYAAAVEQQGIRRDRRRLCALCPDQSTCHARGRHHAARDRHLHDTSHMPARGRGGAAHAHQHGLFWRRRPGHPQDLSCPLGLGAAECIRSRRRG